MKYEPTGTRAFRKAGKETGDDRNPGLAPACGAHALPHCWLSPLSWASFAPAVKRFKRKHILSPYGKGQELEGEQVLAQGIPGGQQRCRLVLSSLICSRNSQGGANLLHV